MSLKGRAAEAFEAAVAHTDEAPELVSLQQTLATARGHLDEPMRVAIVGQIKAGKSTMLNALLGEEMAATGREELTFNVNWFRYGKPPSLTVHFKDGREPEQRTLTELEELSSRDNRDENRELLTSIRYVEIRHPNDILQSFDLVDTPGLKSFFGTDSLNTLAFLGRTVEELEKETREESGNADALLCLFNRSAHASDHALVSEFQGPLLGEATPINAIGVLTKIDTYWPGAEDPLEEGRKVAAGIEAQPGADRVFYTVLPVSGLLALGARTVTGEELEALAALSRLDEELVRRRLRNAPNFTTREYEDVPVPPELRNALFDRLGQYGIWEAARLMREGADSEDEIRAALLERSGMHALRDLVTSHFGRRALLIKARTGIRKGLAEVFTLRQQFNGDAARAASAAGGELEALEAGEPAFEEFALLRTYYHEADSLSLTDEEGVELRRVTGEEGTSIGERLGLGDRALPGEMMRVIERRLSHWRQRREGFGADTQTRATARVMLAAYQRLLYHAREARRHLELDP